jgi:hypothetical protein
LGRSPKDFDIATDATPNEIKRLFRNCRLVGRRFRLAHLHFQDEIIEVSTFRAAVPENSDPHEETGDEGTDGRRLVERHLKSEDGMVLRDNVFGTPEEDALRRDFTINALFYNISDFSVMDYTTGLSDLEQRILRPIGDPAVRFTEDPVRMVRAVRFAASHGFTIEPSAWEALCTLAPSITRASPARLYEEVLKLFLKGSARQVFPLLEASGLFAALFPFFQIWIEGNGRGRWILETNLTGMDDLHRQGEPCHRVFSWLRFWGPSWRKRPWRAIEKGPPTNRPSIRNAPLPCRKFVGPCRFPAVSAARCAVSWPCSHPCTADRPVAPQHWSKGRILAMPWPTCVWSLKPGRGMTRPSNGGMPICLGRLWWRTAWKRARTMDRGNVAGKGGGEKRLDRFPTVPISVLRLSAAIQGEIMGRYFNPEEVKLAAMAFRNAEQLVGLHFRMEPEDVRRICYDVKTLAWLEEHEVREGAFAHLCKYGYGDGHFYRICLQDDRILDAVSRAHSFIKLSPLMLYIAAHELVHVIRFDRGEADFDGAADEKLAEEEKVHSITGAMLQSCMTGDLKLVLDCFSDRYKIGDLQG